MRKILYIAVVAALRTVAWCAQAPAPAPQAAAKKSTPKKQSTAPAKSAKYGTSTRTAGTRTSGTRTVAATHTGARTTATHTAASRTARKPVPRTTWRNRQTTPSPERYKEIQEALASKGYLKPEEAGGAWGQSSADALKRFQADQNLESTGKINSLSLIALGLGPKHDGPATPPKPPVQ